MKRIVTLLFALMIVLFSSPLLAGSVESNVSSIKEALKKNPKNFDLRMLLARTYASLGKFDKAEWNYLDLIEEDENRAAAYNDLGIVYLQMGNADRAIEELRLAVEKDPRFAEAHYNLAEVALASKKPEFAVLHFRKCLELDPQYPLARHKLGVALGRMGFVKDAVSELEKASKEEPANQQIKSDLAFLHLSMNAFDKAAQGFRKVLETQSQSSMAHYGLGLALEGMEKKEEAIREFQKAHETSPKFIDPYLEAGDLLIELGRAAEGEREYRLALPLYQKILKERKSDVFIRMRLVPILIRLGEKKEVKGILKSILKLENKKGPLYLEAKSLMEKMP